MTVVTIPLASGFQAQVGVLTGKEQKLLTKSDGRPTSDKIHDLLFSLVYSIGDIDVSAMSIPEKTTLFSGMPSCDKASLLVGIRLASLPGEEKFNFDFKYINRERKETILPKEFDLSAGFPMFPIKQYNHISHANIGTIQEYKKALEELAPVQYDKYSELLDNLTVRAVLPDSKLTYQFTVLTQAGENIGMNIKVEERSSHSILLMRNPVYFLEGKDTPIRFTERDLDKLSLRDIEFMRILMKSVEGRVDTEVMFEHPEAEFKPRHEKQVIINLVNEISFFFPSGAM